jgi:long-subunit acyl-CoA synthetase (AMP-forming)
MTFAKAVIKSGATDRSGVAIMGFNSPEWIFAFAGGLMANSLVTGVYITNEAEACLY